MAHTILVIVWHVLHDEVAYTDLGADFYTERNDPICRRRGWCVSSRTRLRRRGQPRCLIAERGVRGKVATSAQV